MRRSSCPRSRSPRPTLRAAQRGRGEIEEIVVEDQADSGYRTDTASLTKLTEPLRDVPQSIVTVSRELIDDRGATSLNDALRTVPGISLGAGEFGWQGNNPKLRGFSSRNDMFLDGMRDFGSYPRDPFNLESVEVLQGPTSMIFGRGSTGGVINQVSKRPTLAPLTQLELQRRQRRDAARGRRYHAAVAGFGLGRRIARERDGASTARSRAATSCRRSATESRRASRSGWDGPTQVTLSYLHQSTDDVPDYGLPSFNEHAGARASGTTSTASRATT